MQSHGLRSNSAFSWTSEPGVGHSDSAITRSSRVRCSVPARSTVAIRSFNKRAGNMSFCFPPSFPDSALFVLFLGRSEKTPPQSFLQNLYPARLTITAPGARQFLRAKLNLVCRTVTLDPATALSAARIFALRDRGLRSISSSLAVTGFFVSSR